MVTYAQLQSESWWGREIVPAPLTRLGERLRRAHGRPAAAVGVKGDNAHLNGAHRSQEWIERSRFCTNRSYTVQPGLTAQQERYLAGFDYNPGSTARMIELCRRLDEAVRAGRLEIVREWYGNDDGDRRVDGYDNVRNRIATSDASHLWHIHLTFDRRLVDNEAAVRAVGDVLLGEAQQREDDMVGLKLNDSGPQVLFLQAMLSAAGFAVEGGADGRYGPNTAKAVLACRKSEGSGTASGNTIDHWGAQQIHRAVARRRAEAAANAVGEQLRAALETALAALPSMPDSITIDLPDTITVPVEPAADGE